MIPVKITEILDEAFRSSGLEVIKFETNSKLASIGGKVSYFPHIVATVVHSHDPNCASFSFSIGVYWLQVQGNRDSARCHGDSLWSIFMVCTRIHRIRGRQQVGINRRKGKLFPSS